MFKQAAKDIMTKKVITASKGNYNWRAFKNPYTK